MLMYILKRLGLAILTIWVVITVTFFVMHAVPGGPFLSEKAVSEAAQKALEAKYGLDKPLFEQYITYLKDIVTRFDFGPSLKLRGRQVVDIIGDGMKTSAKLGLIAAFSSLIVGHALKNALIPVITYFGPMLAYIVTGSLVVEQIFAVPGIGRAFVSSITGRDYPLIMGTTIILAALIVIMNLVSDILYKVVDPRINLE